MRQIARIKGWPRLWKYGVIGDWTAIDSMMQLTGQNRFMRSLLSGGYSIKWQMEVENIVHGHHIQGSVEQWVNRNSQSMRASSLMANGNGKWFNQFYSTMSDVCIVLVTFLAHFWMVICKSDPHWLFAKWYSFALPSRAWSNLSTCGLLHLAQPKFSFN